MAAPTPVDHPDVYELDSGDAPILFKAIAGEVVSANVTGGTLICYDGEDNSAPKKLTLTSSGDTVESLQSFNFTKLYLELSGGVAYIKMR